MDRHQFATATEELRSAIRRSIHIIHDEGTDEEMRWALNDLNNVKREISHIAWAIVNRRSEKEVDGG